MANKKTVKIVELINQVNDKNKKSTCNADVRRGWNALLESVLMAAECYEGFRYLHTDEVPTGELPGIHIDYADNQKRTFPDTTRIAFYTPKHLHFF